MSWDVLIAGGGSAGIAAAISASLSGAKTLLVERHGTLGGMATASLVHSICGLYLTESQPANPGFGPLLARRLIETNGAFGPVKMGRLWVLPHHPPAFASLADQWTQTAGVDVHLHTELLGVDPKEGVAELYCRGRSWKIQARAFVDATGDALLAQLAGAPLDQVPSPRLQRPAYIFGLSGVPEEAVNDSGRLRLAALLAKAVASGTIPEDALGTTIHGTGRNGIAYVTLNLHGGDDYDPLDSSCLSALERTGRRLASSIVRVWQDSLLPDAIISAFPARAGIRESRRLIGRSTLTLEDFDGGQRFEDEIAQVSWPIEGRESPTQMRLRFPRQDSYCGIPLGCLQTKTSENLLVAGRCISCSHDVQASIRVIGTCFATGEAAGIAAALCSKGKEPSAKAINIAKQRLIEREYR